MTGPIRGDQPIWFDNVTTDWHVWYHAKNDLRTIGLWRFDIPTLNQVSAIMTPAYFLLVSEFLSHSSDRQMRNFIGITRPDERVMSLWGVRYVITDKMLPVGSLRAEMPIQTTSPPLYQSPIKVYELSEPNLGDYSPINVINTQDAAEALKRMKGKGFNGRYDVITDSKLAGNFVTSTGTHLTIIKGGFRLRSESPSESLLVLPIQYSHCWTPDKPGSVTFFRANLLQLGVKFKGVIDLSVHYRFGPLWNSTCRTEDAKDARRLQIQQARTGRQ
ncbi:MAG: hypothetical protein AB7E67_06460 [Xanthobacteraceae bacterium]